MFVQLPRFLAAAAAFSLLSACSSSDPADSASYSNSVAAAPQRAAIYLANPALLAAAPAASADAMPAGAVRLTESERGAEQVRLVDYEQAYSIEMNRLARAQAEREQRSALAARAGVLQGPGCEGTEGYAAQECERSLL